MVDYYKYLKCPACKKIGLYCIQHKIEVEKLLEESNPTHLIPSGVSSVD